MDNQLYQWTAAYLSSTDQGEPVTFAKLQGIVRSKQSAGVLDPIIFAQLFGTIQALKVMNAVNPNNFQKRIKKVLALLYRDNDYLTKITTQVSALIVQSEQNVQQRGGIQAVQPNPNPVRRGPPIRQSIR